MTSLNPLHTVERQIGEILDIHQGVTGEAARRPHRGTAGQGGYPRSETRLLDYPHQLSGGQRQRVMIRHGPGQQSRSADCRRAHHGAGRDRAGPDPQAAQGPSARDRHGAAAITHDLGIVRTWPTMWWSCRRARWWNMARPGRSSPIPSMPIRRCCSRPKPKGAPPPSDSSAPVVLETKGLKVWFPIRRGFFRRTIGHIKAGGRPRCDGARRQTLGVVGESGSGKTTLGLALLRLIASEGPIVYMGKPIDGYNSKMMRPAAQGHAGRLPGPFGSLSPRCRSSRSSKKVCWCRARRCLSTNAARSWARRCRRSDSIPPPWTAIRTNSPADSASASPSRARLALEPRFIMLDEPTSALDMSVQAQIVDLLRGCSRSTIWPISSSAMT